jgi:isopenicillin N synthase-like dioxygenase
MNPSKQLQLPVLDLSQLNGSETQRQQFFSALRSAARDVGFFYLTGHGISQDRQQQVLQLARDFFALPKTAKQQIQMIHSPHFRGYTGVAGELTMGQPDQREQFDIMREDIASGLPTPKEPWRRLIGPNQWPASMPQMKTELLSWQQQLSDLTETLLSAFMQALELPADALQNTIKAGPYQHMKLIRYPGQSANDSKQGVGAHKDPGYLTLVLQAEQSGLEVLTDDGWIKAEPLAGAFVVNIGELLELASNGYLKATLHRVVSPKAGVERYSCAFFMAAQLDATVPLLQLPAHLAQEAKGPASDPLNPLFYQVGENVLKGRLRSHKDVAASHYADLADLAVAS